MYRVALVPPRPTRGCFAPRAEGRPCPLSTLPVPLPKPRARHELACIRWPQERRASDCRSLAGVVGLTTTLPSPERRIKLEDQSQAQRNFDRRTGELNGAIRFCLFDLAADGLW